MSPINVKPLWSKCLSIREANGKKVVIVCSLLEKFSQLACTRRRGNTKATALPALLAYGVRTHIHIQRHQGEQASNSSNSGKKLFMNENFFLLSYSSRV
jgi:hypothetical protein